MSEIRLGVIMNGVTGRMGTNQHLIRSILAIRRQGGVVLSNNDRVIPDPLLVGRNSEKLNSSQQLTTSDGGRQTLSQRFRPRRINRELIFNIGMKK